MKFSLTSALATRARSLTLIRENGNTVRAKRVNAACRTRASQHFSMLRFRWPLFALALLVTFVLPTDVFHCAARADDLTLYVGGYTKTDEDGLCALRFDSTTGILSAARVVAPLSNPDWLTLSPDHRTLYAGGARDGQSGLSAFAIENNGNLRPISQQISSESPVSLAVDATQKWLVGAYYNSGSWGVWPLHSDGTIGERARLIRFEGSGPNPSRQQSPHAHQAIISPDNKRIWICDLGTDKAIIYDFDAQTGAVTPSRPAFVALAPGSGPRHLAFKKRGGLAYVVGELNSTITVFEFANGQPRAVQTISTLPAGFAGQNTGAEISVSPDERFVLASNRGYDSIAVFQISREGRLFLQGHTKVSKEPRHFTFDPTGKWVLVGNQQTRSIEVFAFDKTSGKLTFQRKFDGVLNEPTCLVFGK